MARDFRMVGVVGLGTMGAGIVEVFAREGLAVVGVEPTEDALERGRGHLTHSTDRAVRRGKLSEADRDALIDRVRFTTSMEDLADVDLMIEAVPERLDLKQEIFAAADKICRADAILATNTSSLSVTEISVATTRPHAGHRDALLQPCAGPEARRGRADCRHRAGRGRRRHELARRLGKTPVVIGDKAGFIANALLFGYLNHAVSMLESHYATREDIDAAMRLGCGYPMGPLALLDLIGLDTAYEILDTMYRQSRDRLHAPAPILKQMVTAGLRGRKTGRGFYTYEGPDSPKVVDDAATPAAGAEHAAVRDVQRIGVVGSGTMATGIVEVLAKAGYDVLYVARGEEKVARVRAAIERSLDKAVLRGKVEQAERDAALARVHGSARLDDLADRDLVIEAVVEELSVKQALFATLDEICQPGTVLATTTSSLPVIDLAAATTRPSGRGRAALLQPGAGDGARRGGQHRLDRGGRDGHGPGGVRASRQARGGVRRPGRLHRQRAAVPLPQRRGQDAPGPLRHRRGHRRRDDRRLRLPDGPVRPARRGRASTSRWPSSARSTSSSASPASRRRRCSSSW